MLHLGGGGRKRPRPTRSPRHTVHARPRAACTRNQEPEMPSLLHTPQQVCACTGALTPLCTRDMYTLDGMARHIPCMCRQSKSFTRSICCGSVGQLRQPVSQSLVSQPVPPENHEWRRVVNRTENRSAKCRCQLEKPGSNTHLHHGPALPPRHTCQAPPTMHRQYNYSPSSTTHTHMRARLRCSVPHRPAWQSATAPSHRPSRCPTLHSAKH